MGNSLLQLIALAAVAIFLIFKLRRTLGTRDGFENPDRTQSRSAGFQPKVIEPEEPAVDRDISKFVDGDSRLAKVLARMKQADGDFKVADFLDGAARAYEMILLAFAEGRLRDISPFISEEVHESFSDTVRERAQEGVSHVARFVGLRESGIRDASLNEQNDAEITVEFVAELISYAVDEKDEIIQGDDKAVRRQRDVWTFARDMGGRDPNWRLVATGE